MYLCEYVLLSSLRYFVLLCAPLVLTPARTSGRVTHLPRVDVIFRAQNPALDGVATNAWTTNQLHSFRASVDLLNQERQAWMNQHRKCTHVKDAALRGSVLAKVRACGRRGISWPQLRQSVKIAHALTEDCDPTCLLRVVISRCCAECLIICAAVGSGHYFFDSKYTHAFLQQKSESAGTNQISGPQVSVGHPSLVQSYPWIPARRGGVGEETGRLFLTLALENLFCAVLQHPGVQEDQLVQMAFTLPSISYAAMVKEMLWAMLEAQVLWRHLALAAPGTPSGTPRMAKRVHARVPRELRRVMDALAELPAQYDGGTNEPPQTHTFHYFATPEDPTGIVVTNFDYKVHL